MTDKYLLKRVKEIAKDEDKVFNMLLDWLDEGKVTMKQLQRTIGEGSANWPTGYPNKEFEMRNPTFLVVLSVELERRHGNTYTFAY